MWLSFRSAATLQTVDNAIVDVGASNVEDLLGLMQLYEGSHEDFDCYVVPTVPPLKQQQDTIATLIELSQLGISASRLKVVFNMVSTPPPGTRPATPRRTRPVG